MAMSDLTLTNLIWNDITNVLIGIVFITLAALLVHTSTTLQQTSATLQQTSATLQHTREQLDVSVKIQECLQLNQDINDALTKEGKCSTDEQFLTMLSNVEKLGLPLMDLDAIYNKMNPQPNNSKTEYYADKGDFDTTVAGESSLGSVSITNGMNDFSRFRRWKSDLKVKRWVPNDELLEETVRDVFFSGDTAAFESYLEEITIHRTRCLQLLDFREVKDEKMVQLIFCRLLILLLGRLKTPPPGTIQAAFTPNYGPLFRAFPINGILLTANLPIRDVSDSDTPAELKILHGFADIGIYKIPTSQVRTKATVEDIQVVCEIKPRLRTCNTYAQKDQLLIEMEAVRQHKNVSGGKKANVRGFLTDCVSLNMVIGVTQTTTKDAVYYVAKRICSHRQYIVRLLFLLCDEKDIGRQKWKQLLYETPIKTKTSGYKTRSNQTSSASKSRPNPAVISASAGAKTSVNKMNSRSRNCMIVTDSSPSQTNKDTTIVNFKDDEGMEEYEEWCRQSFLDVMKHYGYYDNYLCPENLAKISDDVST